MSFGWAFVICFMKDPCSGSVPPHPPPSLCSVVAALTFRSTNVARKVSRSLPVLSFLIPGVRRFGYCGSKRFLFFSFI